MNLRVALPLLAVLSSSYGLWAQYPGRREGVRPGASQLALKGKDPVALCRGQEVDGLPEHSGRFGRYHYRFANAANARAFANHPHRFAVQWDGACGRMGPLSGRGDPERFAVHDGKIFLFASDQCRAGFLKAPELYLPKEEKVPEPGAEARAQGEAWIAKAVQAHGGAAAIDAAAALELVSRGVQRDWRFERKTTIRRDGAIRREVMWQAPKPAEDTMRSARILAADAAFSIEEGEIYDTVTKAERHDLARIALQQPLTVLWARKRAGFRAAFAGTGEVDGAAVVRVAVEVDGLRTTLYLDAKTGKMRGQAWRGRVQDGTTQDVEERFRVWETVDGVEVLMGRESSADGTALPPARWGEARLMQRVPRSLFADPRAIPDDRTAVRRAVQDYVEALYQARPELIRRSVHPALEKLGLYRPAESATYGVPGKMTFDQLVDLAGTWNKDGRQGKDLAFEIKVLDLLDRTASARLSAVWGVDHMQLVKRDDRWQIIHILWQSHPPKR